MDLAALSFELPGADHNVVARLVDAHAHRPD
jgi:hypothetical protein